MASITSFTIVLMSLACAVSVYDLKNPDTRRDWNTFLERFATYEICLTGNKSAAFSRGSLYELDNGDATILNLPRLSAHETVKKVSFRSKVIVRPPFGERISNEAIAVTGQITGRQLGLRGVRSRYLVNVTIDLPRGLDKKKKCSLPSKSCSPIAVDACIHFYALQDVFPKTKKPDHCRRNRSVRRQKTYMETLHASSLFRSYRCRKLPKIQIVYKVDPSLTVMLSKTEKEVARNHLMNTSYLLLVFLVLFFIYGSTTEKRNPYTVVHQSDDEVMKE